MGIIISMTNVYGRLFSVEMSQTDLTNDILSFTANDISELKEFFKGEINSKRRFEEISTAEELFIVLEDRVALTDDVLIKVGPNFQNFVRFQREKATDCKELVIPKSVVKVISDNFPDEWEKLGVQLKIPKEQISQCEDLEDVLMSFRENCKGVSPQEMTFRLNRGLEKCGKDSLKTKVFELMRLEL